MPIISNSSYTPPTALAGRHRMTIAPALLRLTRGPHYQRTRIDTPDGDFLDLDFAFTSRHSERIEAAQPHSNRLVIIQHGLEGSSQAQYVRGMARLFLKHGFDVLAWNFRGCSGVMNRRPRTYHSGFIEDLQVVLKYVLKHYSYPSLALIGFSLGGNLTLKYMGEVADRMPPEIKTAVAFSVPCDLTASSRQLARKENRIYMQRFLKTLVKKTYYMAEQFPGSVNTTGLKEMQTFAEFDDQVTGPVNGFQGAQDYWQKCSSKQFLPLIKRPTLLINARTDPFLPPECYPFKEAQQNPYFTLETPEHGGHVGFLDKGWSFWSEKRALEFIKTHLES